MENEIDAKMLITLAKAMGCYDHQIHFDSNPQGTDRPRNELLNHSIMEATRRYIGNDETDAAILQLSDLYSAKNHAS